MTISFVLISFCNRYQPKYHRNLRNLDDVYQKVPSSWSMFLLSIEVFEKHAVAFVGYANSGKGVFTRNIFEGTCNRFLKNRMSKDLSVPTGNHNFIFIRIYISNHDLKYLLL